MAPDGRDGIQKWHQLGDVIAVAVGQDDREQGAARLFNAQEAGVSDHELQEIAAEVLTEE